MSGTTVAPRGVLGVACAVGAAALLSGCVARTAASVERGAYRFAPPRVDWPAGVTPGRFALSEGGAHVDLEDLPYSGPGTLALLRLRELPPEGAFASVRILAPGGRASLTLQLSAPANPGRETAGTTTSLGTYLFSSASETRWVTGRGERDEVQIAQDPSVLWLNRPEGEPRGIALLLSGLSGLTPGGERLRDALIDRGWLTVFSTPSLMDPAEPLFAFDDEDPTDRAADELAHRINASLAHRAYAIEAVHGHLMSEEPALRALPTVAVGCSAGAIALPAVVARMPDRIDAAVLIGGGADLVDIVSTSSLLGQRLNIMLNDRTPTPAELDAVRRKTLERATLDPYHTALYMDRVPTLLVDARFDAIVPARAGDLLYERMGRPERWRYALGHVGLFVWLSTQVDEVMQWIERAVATSAPTRERE